MTVQQPQRLSAMLGQVASIATIKSTALGLSRLDKQASRESDRNHNAVQGASKVGVSRLPGEGEERVKLIGKCVTAIKEELFSRTTDWNGDRLLANTILPEWLAVWSAAKAEYDRQVSELLFDAPRLIADAERNKGTYNIEPPTIEEMESAFSLDFDMKQIPDASSYRSTGLNTALEDEIRRRFEAGIEAAYTNAVTDALTRVAKPLGNMVERLTVYSKTEEVKARGAAGIKSERLYETVITNVQDIAKVFGSFNLTNNPLMSKVADQLKAFDGIDIESLKGSDQLRKHVTKTAEDILKDLVDLI